MDGSGLTATPTEMGRSYNQQMDAAPLPRGLAPALRAALADTPVVYLLGPRQCGKTTLARSLAPDYGYVALPRSVVTISGVAYSSTPAPI